MGVNRDKPDLWKGDISQSVDMYNAWFMKFAPATYRSTRIETTQYVEDTLKATKNLTDVTPAVFKALEGGPVLPTLRMATCPPLAVDRLIGLAGVASNLVKSLEEGKIPPRMAQVELDAQLTKIGNIIERMADPDIFVWLAQKSTPSETELYRASTIVADRLCGSQANPIIRNAQEQRQLAAIADWLNARGYKEIPPGSRIRFNAMAPATFSFRLNVIVNQPGSTKTVNIPVDAVVMPKTAKAGQLPLLIEAKSAGDFTNVNKRRKEEAHKVNQLRNTYGSAVNFILFLCGYFDGGYLGYEALEGIDWVWEHRIDDLAQFGL